MTRRPPLSPLFPYTTLFRSARGAVRHGIEPEAPPTFVSLLAAVFWIVVAGLLIVGRGEGMAEWKALGEALCAAGLALRSEEHTSELQSRRDLVCRLLLEKKK